MVKPSVNVKIVARPFFFFAFINKTAANNAPRTNYLGFTKVSMLSTMRWKWRQKHFFLFLIEWRPIRKKKKKGTAQRK